MSETTAPLAGALRSARQSRRIAEFAIPLLIAAVALPLVGQIFDTLSHPPPGMESATVATKVAVHLIKAAPAILMAWAVFGCRKVLAEYEKGRFLSLTASEGLRRLGQWTLIALTMKFVVSPIAVVLLLGKPFEYALVADAFDAGVLFFACFMLVVGSVLESAARALKAENDDFV